MSFLTVAVTFAFCGISLSYAAVFNTDTRYTIWPKNFPSDSATYIPVYIDAVRYDATTLANIRAAMAQMSRDLNGCVLFYEYYTGPAPPPNIGRDFIYISNVNNQGQPQTVCGTVPGRQTGQNGNGQKMYIIGGNQAGNCGSQRSVMARLSNALGLRTEYLRPDRPITVTPTNVDSTLQQYNLYNAYTGSIQTSNWATVNGVAVNTNFDYNSITMVPPQTNGQNGQAVYTIPGGQTVGNQNRLSITDCMAIASKYTCSAQTGLTCQDPYGTGTGGGGTPVQPGGNGTPVQPGGGGTAVQPGGNGTPVQPGGGGTAVQPGGGGTAVQPGGGGTAVQPGDGGTAVQPIFPF